MNSRFTLKYLIDCLKSTIDNQVSNHKDSDKVDILVSSPWNSNVNYPLDSFIDGLAASKVYFKPREYYQKLTGEFLEENGFKSIGLGLSLKQAYWLPEQHKVNTAAVKVLLDGEYTEVHIYQYLGIDSKGEKQYDLVCRAKATTSYQLQYLMNAYKVNVLLKHKEQ